MTDDFLSIRELKYIKEQKVKLLAKESELSTPLINDLDMIPVLYEWFKESCVQPDNPGRNQSAHLRKQFIFIVLYLYAPGVLAGGRIPNGLRNKIAMAIHLKDRTFISHNIENIVFMYHNYRDFREEIRKIYTVIEARLKYDGAI